MKISEAKKKLEWPRYGHTDSVGLHTDQPPALAIFSLPLELNRDIM